MLKGEEALTAVVYFWEIFKNLGFKMATAIRLQIAAMTSANWYDPNLITSPKNRGHPFDPYPG